MNPYETDPRKIPGSDLFADDPLYGRYTAPPDDFSPEPRRSDEDLEYWDGVLSMCTEDHRLQSIPETRDIYALGRVVVHSPHLQSAETWPTKDCSRRDLNEVAALEIVRAHFPEMPVPQIYFQGRLRGGDVLIQERLEGVGLNVAWPYLTLAQKTAFKEQTRHIVDRLATHRDPRRYPLPSYVHPDPDPVTNREIKKVEHDILFAPWDRAAAPPSFAHNDLTESNLLVRDDRIVGIIDWEMAGFFGTARAAAVHRQARKGTAAHYARAKLSEDKLRDLLFWNDPYG